MLRRIDRILSPLTWVAAAFTVLLLFAGPQLIGADKPAAAASAKTPAGAAPDGRALFVDRCGGCHTLAAAGTTGTVGPNLGELKPDAATVTSIVRSGGGSMPSFKGDLSAAQIAAIAAFVAGDAPPAPATATPAATATAAASPRVTSSRTDRGPDGITFADGRVWVANATAGTFQRFDGSSGKPVGSAIKVGREPDQPTVRGGEAWVVLTGDDAVIRLKGVQRLVIDVGSRPEDLVVAGGDVWVTNAGDGTVTRIDRASGRVSGPPIRVGGRPLGIAAGGGSIWVTSYRDSTVTRLDPATGAAQGSPIAVGRGPRSVVVGAGTVWVADSGAGTVTRLDSKTGAVRADPIPVGADPRDLAFGDGAVWVASAGDDSVTRIDAATGVAGKPIRVGDDPIGVAVGGGAVWTTNFRADTLSRVTP